MISTSTRTIEIDDTLDDIVDEGIDLLKDAIIDYLDANPDYKGAPDLFNDIDYDGSFHELVDGLVPIYTAEINDIFYLHGYDVEQAFDDAGIGEKKDDDWPMGWKAAAIYCYIEEQLVNWYNEEADTVYDEWREKNPLPEEDE